MYWGLSDGDVLVTVVGQYDTLYLICIIMKINMWFVCVCVCVCEELDKVLLRIFEGTGTTWKN